MARGLGRGARRGLGRIGQLQLVGLLFEGRLWFKGADLLGLDNVLDSRNAAHYSYGRAIVGFWGAL